MFWMRLTDFQKATDLKARSSQNTMLFFVIIDYCSLASDKGDSRGWSGSLSQG